MTLTPSVASGLVQFEPDATHRPAPGRSASKTAIEPDARTRLANAPTTAPASPRPRHRIASVIAAIPNHTSPPKVTADPTLRSEDLGPRRGIERNRAGIKVADADAGRTLAEMRLGWFFPQLAAGLAWLAGTAGVWAGEAPAALAEAQPVRFDTPAYAFRWSPADDRFTILDPQGRQVLTGVLEPAVETKTGPEPLRCQLGQPAQWELKERRLTVRYRGVNGAATLELVLTLADRAIWIEPVEYEAGAGEDVLSVTWFAHGNGSRPVPSLACSRFVVPGLSMAGGISPVVPNLAGVRVTASLGAGTGPGQGFFQQWGLPVHYFGGYHAGAGYGVAGAFTRRLSGGFCWGLAELPAGDLGLVLDGDRASPKVSYRSDLWGQARGPGRLRLGARVLLTLAPTWHEAIRAYYRELASAAVVPAKAARLSTRQRETALAPQFNTWGAEVAQGKEWGRFDEATLTNIYTQMRAARFGARLFVIDAKWEEGYGTLEHSPARFPHFEEFLARVRADGFKVGLWAAFLRCEDPARCGLGSTNLFRRPDGAPLEKYEGNTRYYLFDFTQPAVQALLRERARNFMRRYRPDLVKFDFGYELPPLQQGAPWRMDDAGERLLFKALEVVVGAMREVDPDLVVMYYGLSPFLGPWVDLHSPDDLWLCPGDYALEANRRFFFSGLLGELGIPTLGSTGYDWASAPSIWFDAAPVGTLGSLQSFAGDEIDSAPTPLRVAKYNGLVHLLRPSPEFTVMPLDPPSNSAIFGANASSWARLERGQPVMVALRDRRWDGAPGPGGFGGWLTSDTSVVIASATDEPIPAASRLGIVPFGNGRLVLRRQDPASAARAREFRFDGTTRQWRLPIRAGKLEVPLAERAPNGAAVEWIELDFSRGAPPPGSPRSGNR